MRLDADGVGDVAVAGAGERLGLGEGGDGDGAGGAVVQEGGGVQAFGRLHMGAEDDPEAVRPRAQAGGVAPHPVHVDHGERGVGIGQGLGGGGGRRRGGPGRHGQVTSHFA